MKLKVYKRPLERKCEVKTIRREGNIPAVIYSQGRAGENIVVDGVEFRTLLRRLQPGHLPATILVLQDEQGKQRRALVKDIQYHVTSYDIQHLDLIELFDDVPVSLNIPIEYLGVADCVGVKLGGVLRPVIRHLKVKCDPKHIPASFQLDVRHLNLKQVLRLKDIAIPESVRPLVDLNEVAVVIAKR